MVQAQESPTEIGSRDAEDSRSTFGLTPGTVSAVLNDAPSARSIPQETKNGFTLPPRN